MQIRFINNADIPKWKALSSEYDCYVKESVSDLTEWYDGSDDSPAFDFYIEAKINQREALMAVDAADNCLGVIAFSKKSNRITFFAVTHSTDFRTVGKALVCHALQYLDNTKSIYINEIISSSTWMKQHRNLYLSCGFAFSCKSIENGVHVNTFEKFPLFY